MVEDDAFHRDISMFNIFPRGDHMVDGAKACIGDDEDRELQPGNNIFQIVHRLLIVADGAHDAAGAFHGHVGIRLGHALPSFQNDLLLQRMAFQLRRQVRRHGVLIQIGKNHILRLADTCKLIHKSRVRRRHGGRAADGRLVVACVIARLPQCLHDQRGHIGLADVRISAGDKKSFAHSNAISFLDLVISGQ